MDVTASNHRAEVLAELAEVEAVGRAGVVEVEGGVVGAEGEEQHGEVGGVDVAVAVGVAEQAVNLIVRADPIVAGNAIAVAIQSRNVRHPRRINAQRILPINQRPKL